MGWSLSRRRDIHYCYDDYGNLTAIQDYIKEYYDYTVDSNYARETKFTYNPLHKQLTRRLPDGKTEYKYYDEFGRIIKAMDFKGQVTGYEYNVRGLLEFKKFYANDTLYTSDDPNILYEYTYDNLGRKRIVEVNDLDAVTVDTCRYDYDAEGRVVEVNTPQGTINYEYDEITGKKINTNTTNADTDYFHDELGRLNQVSTDNEDVTYGYDVVGNREWMEIDADGTTGYEIKTDYTYDNCNRLTDLIQQKAGPSQLAAYNYTVKANGHRHSLNESLHETRDITYGYDNLNRLTDETADSSGDGYDIDYTYDLVGNRTKREVAVNGQNLTTDYVYYSGTDKLQKETHTGPVYVVYLHENDRYYAYAAPNGGYFYRDTRSHTIGSLQAFFIGLPSVWSRYPFVVAMALVPVLLFGPGLLRLANRYVLRRAVSMRLRVPRKGICLLVAFLMLFGPEHFHSLAQAEVQYANLSTASWANGDTTITYTYDDNGSVETKTTVTGAAVEEDVTYHYNLAGRLDKVTTDDQSGTEHVVEYIYNDEGIRVWAYSYDQPTGGGTKTLEKTIVSLVDSYNHTGYAQTLEELTFNKANPDPLTETPDSLRSYVIGDDVIAQNTDGTVEYLLYDGHGSTRQLAEYDTDVTIVDSFSYDGYGVLLQDNAVASSNPGKVGTQATNLLYAGEQFDTALQLYYLRARYYDPLNGRFNRMDPFAGSPQDPQSLHKYLYAHCNPVNAIDPSGLYSLGEMVCVAGIVASISAIVAGEVVRIKGGTEQQIAKAQWKWFWIGFFATVIVYSVVWTIHSIWLWLYGGGQVASNPEVQTHLHHFATNKHSFWTARFEQIVSRYNLSLDDAWNLNPFSTQYHSGSHPEAYHKWVFEQMTRAANEAGQSANQFIISFYKYVVLPVMENPEMLKSAFWQQGG